MNKKHKSKHQQHLLIYLNTLKEKSGATKTSAGVQEHKHTSISELIKQGPQFKSIFTPSQFFEAFFIDEIDILLITTTLLGNW